MQRDAADETSATMMRLAAAHVAPTMDVDVTSNSITMCRREGMVAVPADREWQVRYRTPRSVFTAATLRQR